MVWLDQPALVGFSFHNSSSQPVLGDQEAAREAALFLNLFLAKFSYLRGPLFLSGESFAGVYIPMITAELIKAQSSAFQVLEQTNLVCFCSQKKKASEWICDRESVVSLCFAS